MRLAPCAKVLGLPWWLSQQRSCLRCRRPGFSPWVEKTPWRRKWQTTPVFLLGKSYGERSLEGYRPWDPKSQTCLSNQTTTKFLFYITFWLSLLLWHAVLYWIASKYLGHCQNSICMFLPFFFNVFIYNLIIFPHNENNKS